MDSIKKIAVLESVVEAKMLETILKEQEIPHLVVSHEDTAYDGLFKGVQGWGHIEAAEEHEQEILALIESLRNKE